MFWSCFQNDLSSFYIHTNLEWSRLVAVCIYILYSANVIVIVDVCFQPHLWTTTKFTEQLVKTTQPCMLPICPIAFQVRIFSFSSLLQSTRSSLAHHNHFICWDLCSLAECKLFKRTKHFSKLRLDECWAKLRQNALNVYFKYFLRQE